MRKLVEAAGITLTYESVSYTAERQKYPQIDQHVRSAVDWPVIVLLFVTRIGWIVAIGTLFGYLPYFPRLLILLFLDFLSS